jgi:hypothetical protein
LIFATPFGGSARRGRTAKQKTAYKIIGIERISLCILEKRVKKEQRYLIDFEADIADAKSAK